MGTGRKNILMFTGGGLAPALNASIYGVVSEAKKFGFRVFGGIRGWHCTLARGKIIDLGQLDIDVIKNHGGTFLRSSRVNIFKEKNGVESFLRKLRLYKIDAVIPIGGDDTLGAARELFQKYNAPIVGIPKTIDNDLFGTYWTPGFPTAAHCLAKITQEIKSGPAYALSRIFIIESLGRDAGWLTCASCYGGADVIIPPEGKFILSHILKIIRKRYRANGNYAVVTMCHHVNIHGLSRGMRDGNFDGFGVRRSMYSSIMLQRAIQKHLGIDTKVIMPGNSLEADAPIDIDKKYAILLGRCAVQEAVRKNFGVMVALSRPNCSSQRIKITTAKLDDVVKSNGLQKKMDEQWFDFENCRVKEKYFKYMEPILGKPEAFLQNHQKYLKITRRIAFS